MAVDWCVFWNNFLSALFSSLIILGLGTLIAWCLSHRYQRRNDKTQKKNLLIDEIQELTLLFEEIESLWLKCKDNSDNDIDNFELWYETKLKTIITQDKMDFIKTKLSNWFPDFAEITAKVYLPKGGKSVDVETKKGKTDFESKEGEERHILFSFNDAVHGVFNHCESLLDSLNEMNYSAEISDELEETHDNAMNLMKLMLSTFVKEL